VACTSWKRTDALTAWSALATRGAANAKEVDGKLDEKDLIHDGALQPVRSDAAADRTRIDAIKLR
jgi:hypothetical protein